MGVIDQARDIQERLLKGDLLDDIVLDLCITKRVALNRLLLLRISDRRIVKLINDKFIPLPSALLIATMTEDDQVRAMRDAVFMPWTEFNKKYGYYDGR